jgi:hypothetical protein
MNTPPPPQKTPPHTLYQNSENSKNSREKERQFEMSNRHEGGYAEDK